MYCFFHTALRGFRQGIVKVLLILTVLTLGFSVSIFAQERESSVDLDGDGWEDITVYHTTAGNWFTIGSEVGFAAHLAFGGSNFLPVPGDYDGDGVTDTAVYDTTTGNWFIDQSTAGFRIHPSFGGPGFIPVPGDYDDDGWTDIAV